MKFFSYDSKLSQFLCKAVDCVFVCILWLICLLPVLTVGAATTAALFTFDKAIIREEGHIWKTYWKTFGREFKQATALWGILFIMVAVILFDCTYTYQMVLAGVKPDPWLTYGLAIVAAVFLFWAQYWLPYLAKFEDSVKTILKNTLYIALMNLIQSVILVVLMAGVFVLVVLSFPRSPLVSLGLLAAYWYASSTSYSRILNKYIPAEEPQTISQ